MAFGTQARTFDQEYDQRIDLHSQVMEEPGVERSDTQETDTRHVLPRRSQDDSTVEENGRNLESPYEADQHGVTNSSSTYILDEPANSKPSDSYPSQHNPAQEPKLHRINRTFDFLHHPALSHPSNPLPTNQKEIELEDVDLTDQVQLYDYSTSQNLDSTPKDTSSKVAREARTYPPYHCWNQSASDDRICPGPQIYNQSVVPNSQPGNKQAQNVGFWGGTWGGIQDRLWWVGPLFALLIVAGLVVLVVEYEAGRL